MDKDIHFMVSGGFERIIREKPLKDKRAENIVLINLLYLHPCRQGSDDLKGNKSEGWISLH